MPKLFLKILSNLTIALPNFLFRISVMLKSNAEKLSSASDCLKVVRPNKK